MWAEHFKVEPTAPQEAAVNWNKAIRQFHRWTAIVFTGVVLAIFIALGAGRQPPMAVYYVPLLPLALLAATGLYMFVLPYVARRPKA